MKCNCLCLSLKHHRALEAHLYLYFKWSYKCNFQPVSICMCCSHVSWGGGRGHKSLEQAVSAHWASLLASTLNWITLVWETCGWNIWCWGNNKLRNKLLQFDCQCKEETKVYILKGILSEKKLLILLIAFCLFSCSWCTVSTVSTCILLMRKWTQGLQCFPHLLFTESWGDRRTEIALHTPAGIITSAPYLVHLCIICVCSASMMYVL